jgi:hypothetical protein
MRRQWIEGKRMRGKVGEGVGERQTLLQEDLKRERQDDSDYFVLCRFFWLEDVSESSSGRFFLLERGGDPVPVVGNCVTGRRTSAKGDKV